MKAQMLCHAHMEQSRISCLGPFCEWILVSPMFFLKACRFLKDAVATFFKGLLCLISCPYLAYYWFGIALTKYMLVVLSIRVLFNFRGDISPWTARVYRSKPGRPNANNAYLMEIGAHERSERRSSKPFFVWSKYCASMHLEQITFSKQAKQNSHTLIHTCSDPQT